MRQYLPRLGTSQSLGMGWRDQLILPLEGNFLGSSEVPSGSLCSEVSLTCESDPHPIQLDTMTSSFAMDIQWQNLKSLLLKTLLLLVSSTDLDTKRP